MPLGLRGDVIFCRFWLAVEDLKKRPIREVPSRVQEIWQEFLAPGAPSAINLDSKSYDKTTQSVKEPGRYTFEDAQVSTWSNFSEPRDPQLSAVCPAQVTGQKISFND